MIDHSRIKTGFDCEILLSGEFFRSAIHSLFDSGVIPTFHELNENGIKIIIKRPLKVEVLFENISRMRFDEDMRPVEDTSPFDLEVTFPIITQKHDLETKQTDLSCYLRIEITEIQNKTTKLVDNIDLKVKFAGFTNDSWEWISDNHTPLALYPADSKLRELINFELSDYLLPTDIQKVAVRKLAAVDNFQACFAIYINLDLKLGPTSEVIQGEPGTFPIVNIIPPEPDDEPVDRGDALLGINFLPFNRHIAMGAPSELYKRLSTNQLHLFTKKSEEGFYYRPLDGIDGCHRSIAIGPNPLPNMLNPEKWELIATSEARIKGIDVETKIHMTPTIDENGELKMDINVDEPEADISIVNFGLFFIGALLTIGLAPVTGGISLLAGGIMSGIAVSMVHQIKEGYEESGQEMIEEMIEKKRDSFMAFMSAIPTRLTMVRLRKDPFYYHHHQVVTHSDEVNFHLDGISFCGRVQAGEQDVPIQNVKLVGRIREKEPIGKLKSIIYRVPKSREIEQIENFNRPDPRKRSLFMITPEEAIDRIMNDKLKSFLFMKPERIRYRSGQITEFAFDSRVTLAPHEAVELHFDRILKITGRNTIVRPRKGKPYIKSWRDRYAVNNLSNLPKYNCTQALTLGWEFVDFNNSIIAFAKKVSVSGWHWIPKDQKLSCGMVASHAISTYPMMKEMIINAVNVTPIPEITKKMLDSAELQEESAAIYFNREHTWEFLPGHVKDIFEYLHLLTQRHMDKKSFVPLFSEEMSTTQMIEKLLDYLWSRLKVMDGIYAEYKNRLG